ncbi:MAG: endonuclease/exonuclease/phosphatase family protein [Planctomycetota bacterium]
MSLMSRIGACLCVLLTSVLAAPMTLAQTCEPPGVPLRVVTLNVRLGLGSPGQQAYDAVGDMITTQDLVPGDGAEGLNPDVVAFQELDNSTSGRLELAVYRDAFLPGYQICESTQAGGDCCNYNALLIRPDITVVSCISFSVGGPRAVVRAELMVPGADDIITVYCVHFKAFTDASSQATRALEADTTGDNVLQYRFCGGTCTGPLPPEPTGTNVVVMGDFNSNNNNDGTLDGLFTHFFLAVPTGLQDLAVESLQGATVGGVPLTDTFQGFPTGRLDYVAPDEELTLLFDADNSGGLDQDEINSMGFVYYSNETTPDHSPGQFANGNQFASSQASDHRPVVMDLILPIAGSDIGACCIGGVCCETTEDQCLTSGGVYSGDGTVCGDQPAANEGACCFPKMPDEACAILTEADCIARCGIYRGDGTSCACSCGDACEGDINGDGDTTLADFGILASNFGGQGLGKNQGDLDCDTDVNLSDFTILAMDFGCDGTP